MGFGDQHGIRICFSGDYHTERALGSQQWCPTAAGCTTWLNKLSLSPAGFVSLAARSQTHLGPHPLRGSPHFPQYPLPAMLYETNAVKC